LKIPAHSVTNAADRRRDKKKPHKKLAIRRGANDIILLVDIGNNKKAHKKPPRREREGSRGMGGDSPWLAAKKTVASELISAIIKSLCKQFRANISTRRELNQNRIGRVFANKKRVVGRN
jgi:hypothetical protein